MSHQRRSTPLLVVSIIAAGLVAGRLLPPLCVRLGWPTPHVGWPAGVALLAAALLMGALAWSTWQSVHRAKRQISSDYGLLVLATAKAGIYVGALFAGGYAGYALAYVDLWETTLGRARVLHGGGAALAAVLLLAAALLLERACMLPGGDDEDDDGGKGGSRRSPDPSPA